MHCDVNGHQRRCPCVVINTVLMFMSGIHDCLQKTLNVFIRFGKGTNEDLKKHEWQNYLNFRYSTSIVWPSSDKYSLNKNRNPNIDSWETPRLTWRMYRNQNKETYTGSSPDAVNCLSLQIFQWKNCQWFHDLNTSVRLLFSTNGICEMGSKLENGSKQKEIKRR